MILIADSGSNKTDWRLVNDQKEETSLSSLGINPVYLSTKEIGSILKDTFKTKEINDKVETIYFYGSGCKEVKVKNKMKEALQNIFQKAMVYVEWDLLAACKATCGNNEGFVAILGTGSNSCYYNGESITHQVPSLGYLMGDEGSGNYIGNIVMKRYLRDLYSPKVNAFLNEKIGISKEDLLPKIYAEKKPNIFFSAIGKLIEPIVHEPEITSTIKDCFDDFFTNMIMAYPKQKTNTIHFCGSIGFHYKNLLEETGKKYNFKIGTVLKKPIDALVKFHLP